MDVFIARQPIFNNKKQVIAYELLYRDSYKNYFDGSISSDVATSTLLMNSYYSFGMDKLVGEGKAFINFDKALILNDVPNLLNSKSVVVELLEDIQPDKNFIEKIKTLRSAGYTIALDDYVEGYPYEELVNLSHIIKIDFMGNTKDQIEQICPVLLKKKKLLLAEKVETIEEFIWAKNLGFSLFQGYFFSKPTVIQSKSVGNNAFQYIRLMEELSKKEPNNKRIAEIIEVDVTLTYKILKLVNSNYSLVSNVTSITHALAIMGSNTFKKWLSLATVQNIGETKIPELVKTSLIRANFMEKLGNHFGFRSNSEVPLIGILSVIDALLEKPMEELLESLPLSKEAKATLLNKESKYSPL